MAFEGLSRHCSWRHSHEIYRPIPRRRIQTSADRFKALHQTFKHCLPGDIETAIATYDSDDFQAMYQSDPIYEVLAAQGKIGPFKQALLKAWSQVSPSFQTSQTSASPSSRERGLRAAVVLRLVARCLAGKTFPEWQSCTGRNNQFHSGYLKSLQDWGILRSTTDGNQAEEMLVMGELGTVYVLLKNGDAASVLEGVALAADVMTSALEPAPSRLAEWDKALSKAKLGMDDICKSLGLAHICRLNHKSGYSFLWTFRTLAISRMRHRLLEPVPNSILMLTRCFPDQHQNVSFFAGGRRKKLFRISDLLEVLEYSQEPLQFLTMWLCLLADPDLEDLSIGWIQSHQRQLQAFTEKFRAQHKFWPHPVVAVRAVQDSLTSLTSAASEASRPKPTEKQPPSKGPHPVSDIPPIRLRGKQTWCTKSGTASSSSSLCCETSRKMSMTSLRSSCTAVPAKSSRSSVRPAWLSASTHHPPRRKPSQVQCQTEPSSPAPTIFIPEDLSEEEDFVQAYQAFM
jgi:hypothetical protein